MSLDKSGFYLPLRASFSRRLVARGSRAETHEARLNHAEVPRRSRAHAPPPASASARMSPNLLPTGATAKRSAAEWALRGSWVGKKLGAPAAKCGRGCTASGGTGSHWPPGYATPPPNPPLCAPRLHFFFCKQAVDGRRVGGWAARTFPPVAPTDCSPAAAGTCLRYK